ncbi:lipid A deacylase LpxR family protein [Haloferula sargassicola]|uniref:Lipid A deacylase LpxR family protein n=1 Tax=Haloferula sargassicola TaxID=490096 RepID=A0ABP9UMU5_9BACT
MKTLLGLITLGFACLPAWAALPDPNFDEDGYLTFYLDNDLFAGRDRDYTNGARLAWISGNEPVESLIGVQRYLRRLTGDPQSFGVFQTITGFEDPKSIVYNYGFSLTQLMYTPQDAMPYTQPPYQRRYAGWTGLGFSLHAKDEKILNSVELSIGATGPASLAEETQDFIHDIRGATKFNGWANQIPSELTVDLSFIQKRRLDFANFRYGVIRVDGITEWGARLGTFRTDTHVGGMFRMGYNLPPDFSDPRLSPTAYTHHYFNSGFDYDSHWSVFLLAGGQLTAVGHDATLDGPLFSDFNTGIERRPLVAEVYAGFGIRYRRVEFSYAHTWRTEEYTTQRGLAQIGTIGIKLRF